MKSYIFKTLLYLLGAVSVVSCKRNDPIGDLGETNGQYVAMLNVSYDINKPVFGDTLTVTASTWQRDDKISSLEMTETVVQKFGVNLTLQKGTVLNTNDLESSASTLVVTDTILNKVPWFSIKNDNDQLNAYFETVTNNYIVRAKYPFELNEGHYPNDNTLIENLKDVDFEVLKSILAYRIKADDYRLLYPDAPSTDFTSGGVYDLTQAGINNLKSTLTKKMLSIVLASCAKSGTFHVDIVTNVYTATGASRSVTRNFQTNL
ncbi:hypothetical protein [Sphingobacterium siyangense]|uniref:Uncharacterized protein n=1 Tax=Sphingobacterium siyangense TaxID=459529 RepID=A0A562MCA0_9SPHI|nr:hypothetical protein [Sphingobacterium siyangense]TWI17524.1 hypothetical protein IQ31_03670 [Sphingobacterium siyangense]